MRIDRDRTIGGGGRPTIQLRRLRRGFSQHRIHDVNQQWKIKWLVDERPFGMFQTV